MFFDVLMVLKQAEIGSLIPFVLICSMYFIEGLTQVIIS